MVDLDNLDFTIFQSQWESSGHAIQLEREEGRISSSGNLNLSIAVLVFSMENVFFNGKQGFSNTKIQH